MSKLDVNMLEARRTMVKKMLTTRMRDRLKNEEADYEKVSKRDRSNNLLADNIDGLVKEEGKSNSKIKRLRKLGDVGNNNTV